MNVTSLLRQVGTRFVGINRRACAAVTPAHVKEISAYKIYENQALLALLDESVRTVVDIGTGRTWMFSAAIKRRLGITLIGLELDPVELAHNNSVDRGMVADLSDPDLQADTKADVILARYAFEHFVNNEIALANCNKILRHGGRLIAVFPGRYAPFAIINRHMPHRISAWLVHRLIPGSEGTQGFTAYYDRTDYQAFRRLLENNGFSVSYHYAGYFSSGYFAFFVPLYVCSFAFDLIRFSLGWRPLASFNVFVAIKRMTR